MRAVRLWRTRNPRTFREKVRYKMLRDHRALVVTFADKAAVRDYVATVVGGRYLPRAYAIVDDPAALRDVGLPDSYVVKPTHGSGAAIVVSDRAPREARLPSEQGSWVYRHVRPESAPREDVVRIARGWVAQLYGQGPNREWVYGRMLRRVTSRRCSPAQTARSPTTTSLRLPRQMRLRAGRHRTVRPANAGLLPARLQHVPLSGGPPWADPEPAKPARLSEMIGVAERLGADTDFVRVDLYDVDGRVVFGELTSFPAGGDSPFDPESFNEEFGRPWTVPRRYR